MPEAPSRPDDQLKPLSTKDSTAPVDSPGGENAVPSSVAHEQPELLHVALSEASMRLSPLPPPEELERMERIQSGTLERFLNIMEQDAKTTRENEAKVVDAFVADRQAARTESSRGQIFGLTVAILGFALAGFSLYLGHPVSAVVLCLAQLATLVGVFVVGRRGKNEPDGDGGGSASE